MDKHTTAPAPVVSVHRLLSGSLNVFVPYDGDATRAWFRELTRTPSLKLRWDMRSPGHWVVGRAHLGDVTFGIAERFGEVDLVMDYRRTETCGVKCQHAGALDCTCSCLGRQHGGPSRLNHLAIASEDSLPGRLVRVSRRVTADMAALAR
jgi:hypothetical protein